MAECEPSAARPERDTLEEFCQWFEERYPTGQNISLPGARLYGIYTHARAALAAGGTPAAFTPPLPGEHNLPPRIVVGANGAYWRDFGDKHSPLRYSQCPISSDNDSVEVFAVYERVAAGGSLSEPQEERQEPEARGGGAARVSVGELSANYEEGEVPLERVLYAATALVAREFWGDHNQVVNFGSWDRGHLDDAEYEKWLAQAAALVWEEATDDEYGGTPQALRVLPGLFGLASLTDPTPTDTRTALPSSEELPVPAGSLLTEGEGK